MRRDEGVGLFTFISHWYRLGHCFAHSHCVVHGSDGPASVMAMINTSPYVNEKKNLSKEIIFSRRASTYLTGRIPRKLIWAIVVPRPLEWESSPPQPLTAKRFGLTLHFSDRERMRFDSFILWYPDSGRVTYYTSIATISRRGVKEIALYNFIGSPWEGACLYHKSPMSPPSRASFYF